jgi:predicted ATPase
MIHPLRISLLGTVSFQLNDQPLLNLTSVKAQALLIYLAVTGRPHTRAALAGLLWSDVTEAAAHNSLRVALATLRHAIGDSITATRQSVSLATEQPIWLDVTQFVQACSRLQTADASIEESEYQSLRADVHLYQGDFLAGFQVWDAELFEEWAVAGRAYYCRLALEALTRLAELALPRGAIAGGIEDAQRALALDPLIEEAHQLLMRLYTHNGQTTLALRQYEKCVRLLDEELGVSPSSETTALYEAIRTRTFSRPEPIPKDEERPPPRVEQGAGRRPRHNLPSQTTPFLGRAQEMAVLGELLVTPNERLVTIVAPGGMGKTRLAQEAALAQLEHFPDGVYFVPLAPLNNAEELVPAISDAVNYPMQADPRPPQEQLLDFLRHKNLLLVLDNFEHLLDGSALVTIILEAADHVKILVTSRERIHLSSETIFPLGGLALPSRSLTEENAGSDAVSLIDSADAVKLFVLHARRVTPQFELTEANRQAVVQICRLTFGMPLGIVLAAAWVSLLSVDEIAAEVAQGLDFLEADLRDLPPRQRSLASIFEHTWQRLLPAQRETFMRLAVFRNGFTRQASRVVAGASTKLLLSLADKALIQNCVTGRYEAHESLRQYGLRMLAREGVTEAAHEAHSRYFLHMLETLELDIKGRRQLGALAEIEADLDNIRTAWFWAMASGNYGDMECGVEALYLYFSLRGRSQEGAQFLWRTYRMLDKGTDADMERLRGRILVRYCLVQTQLLTDLAAHERDDLLAHALAGAETRGEQAEIAICWFARGRQEELAGHAGERPTFDAALPYLEEAMSGFRALNDNFYMARAAQSMAHCYGYDMTTMQQHQAYHAAGLAYARLADSVVDEVTALGSLGWAAVDQGQFEEAERHLREAVALSNKLVSPDTVTFVTYGLAFVHFSQGRMEMASRLAEEGMTIARASNSTARENMALVILSLVAGIAGDSTRALQLGEQSLQNWSPRYFRTYADWALALAHCGLGNHELAWHHLRASHSLVQVPSSLPRILAVATVLLGQQGQTERAAELLGAVFSDRHSAHGWMEQWRSLTALRARLQSQLGEAYQRLYERGGTMDPAALADKALATAI